MRLYIYLLALAVEGFIESVGRRSEKIADAYQRGLELFALCHRVDSPDLLVTRIKAGKGNQYQLLDKFISFMTQKSTRRKVSGVMFPFVKSS